MKKHISLILVLTMLFTAMLSFGSVALAEGDVEFKIHSIEPSEPSAGQKVEFNYTITNNTGGNLSNPLICTTTGKTVFDELLVPLGGIPNGTFKMTVTEDMLGETLVFSYGSKTASVKLPAAEEPRPELGGSVTASPQLADAGSTVKLTFKLENHGNVALENIVVSAPELKNGKALNSPFTLDTTPENSSKTFTYSHTMTETVTIHPVATFEVNGKTMQQALNAVDLTLSSRNVSALLSASTTTPQAGDEVTFTLKLTNKGNVPYTHIRVLANGMEQDFPSNLDANSESSGTFKMTFQTSMDVACTITLRDHTGEDRSITSNTVSIELPVDQDAVKNSLQFVMNVDRPQLTSAGTVNFTGYITNGTDYELTDIEVTEQTLGSVFTANTLSAGQKKSLEFTADVNETTTYAFTLSVTDKDGNVYTVSAAPLTVTVQVPVQKSASIEENAVDITPMPSGGGLGSIGVLGIIAIVLVVLIIAVGVALFVLWRKGQQSGKRPTSKNSKARKRPATKGYRDRNNF